MGFPILRMSKNRKPMHYSVGAVIKKDGKYLLIHRRFFPSGWAGVSGHVDVGESAADCIVREVEEEVGLKVKKHRLLFKEEAEGNYCVMGVSVHYWHLFECETVGKIKKNMFEVKGVGWYSASEIKRLKMEKVWKRWFTRLNII